MNISNIQNLYLHMEDTLVKKNQDYGDAFEEATDKVGLTYCCSKMFEKVLRYINLTHNVNQVKGETRMDALLDLIGYASLTYDYELRHPGESTHDTVSTDK